MCGLTLSVHPYPISSSHEALLDSFCQTCAARGPDRSSTYSTKVELGSGQTIELRLSASVLGLRGTVTAQPIIGKRGVLGWNGQVFGEVDIGDRNDTAVLADLLDDGASPGELLAGIEGPYAFVYYEFETKKLYYQLDPLSRRSLLIHPLTLEGESSSSFECLLLSSARSGYAREVGTSMRALGGGEGGVLNLTRIKPNANAKNNIMLDFAAATTSWTSRDGGRYTQLSPVNTTLPVGEAKPSNPSQVDEFINQLRASIRRRVDNIPAQPFDQPRVAVLFSGGVDCTLLAVLLHQCLPTDEPVDLVNVAFAPSGSTTFQTPDRLSGIEAYEELKLACSRDWRLVTVDVSFNECQDHRQRVLDLMYPAATEMDLSLAYPLYFASRGQGRSYGQDEEYHVKAKVFISGLGADEQLGGYSRHRHAFKMNSWQGLIDETQMDITRLPTRNLSRDDRLISSHARDARYPYLDLDFVAYLSDLPISVKCNPSFGEGKGDKMLLRLAAKKLGLEMTSARAKRAMQFGTRSSKMSVSKGPKAGERKVAA